MSKRTWGRQGGREFGRRWCLGAVAGALVVYACMGCDYTLGPGGPIDRASLDVRIAAASDAVVNSGGHDYEPLSSLLEAYVGDVETTAYICGAFIDPPHCFRIAAVNVQDDDLDPAWQAQFCEFEKQAWEEFPWGSETPQQQIDETVSGHFEECMLGLPFFVY